VALLTPHLLLGTWLIIVPDRLAFRTSQVVTLLHVGLALASLPPLSLWIIRHVWRREAARERVRHGGRLARWSLAVATLVVSGTGLAVLRAGDIVRAHVFHAWAGIAVGGLVAWHLWAARRRGAAALIAALMIAAAAGGSLARRFLPPQAIEAAVPAFAYRTRPAALYESAAACGECHVEIYAAWRRSTHGRTMQNPLIREGFVRQRENVGFDLPDFGRIIAGAPVTHASAAFNACEMCHAPTSFYSDDRSDPLHSTGPASEGVTCSFCHTLRAVEPGEGRGRPLPAELGDPARGIEFLPLLPKYVSAPETVRRYLGQGSTNRALHWLSNALIRWRPDVHRHDYRAPVLESNLACMPCHSLGALDVIAALPQKTYRSWELSRYATNDPATNVTCQDCHMARQLTGRQLHESGPLVPWGPVRERNGSHLFLGGNRTVPELLHDQDFALLEHRLNTQMARVTLVAARLSGARLEVDLRLETRHVGHDLPSMGAQNRWLWVQVFALDAAGREVGASRPPAGSADTSGESPVVFRCIDHPTPACDTTLRAGVARAFTARLSTEPGAVPASVRAVLHYSVDRDPIAESARPLPF
jgi:hypothetical protein